MAGIAVVVMANEEQGILLQHRHDDFKEFRHVNAFGDRIADLSLGHGTGTAQVRVIELFCTCTLNVSEVKI